MDCLPKPGQARLCHLVHTHNVVTFEAFDKVASLNNFHLTSFTDKTVDRKLPGRVWQEYQWTVTTEYVSHKNRDGQ